MRGNTPLWLLVAAVLAAETAFAQLRLHYANFLLYAVLQLALALVVTTAAIYVARARRRAVPPHGDQHGDAAAEFGGGGSAIARAKGAAITAACLFLAFYHLYHGVAGAAEPVSFLMTHLGFVLFLAFLLAPVDGRSWKDASAWSLVVDLPLAALALGVMIYVVQNVDGFIWRRGNYELPDIVAGAILIVLILEATRRMVGWGMVLLAVFMLIYTNQAHHFPGLMTAAPSRWDTIVNTQFMETLGIFAEPLQVAASYIVLFLIFGALFVRTGAGQFFMDLAYSMTGSSAGGPAKAAVVASSLFGSISGSAVANVTSTGSFTIPLMKRTGFRPQFAAATESVASTGGQLMPPVMGAAAFVVAEFVNKPYVEVAMAALVPSFLYYLALFIMVHLEARRLGLTGLKRAELPDFFAVMGEGWHLLAPLFVITGILLSGYTATMAGFWGCVSVVAAGMVRRYSRISPIALFGALQDGIKGAVSVSVACAAAGVIVGGMFTSGLGVRLSSMIVGLAGGQIWLVLLLTMLCALILGMGMTTTAVYISVAILIAPALVDLGVEPMAAHLFVLYFGVISCITPPVAIASFAAAGVAGSQPMRTAFVAVRLAAVGFLVPFAFVYGPGLLLIGEASVVILNIVSATIAVVALACGLQGWMLGYLTAIERVLLAAAAVGLITADVSLDLIGLAVLAGVVGFRFVLRSRGRAGERRRFQSMPSSGAAEDTPLRSSFVQTISEEGGANVQ